MKTYYCTSCGKESTQKICEYCGVKRNDANNFCQYCGAQLFPNATNCVNCKERVKKEPVIWTILNLLSAVAIFAFLMVAISEKEPVLTIVCLALATFICLPFVRNIIKKVTIGKKSLRNILKVVRIIAVIVLFAASVGIANSYHKNTENISAEEAYADLVSYAEEGKYIEGWRVTQSVPEVLEYKDGEKYLNYCQAMRAYNAGGIGYAYNTLIKIPDVLDAESVIENISAKTKHLEGHFVADNNKGSNLHIVIKDGLVATEIQGYGNEKPTFAEEDFTKSIVISEYDNGKEFIGFGSYNSTGEKVTVDYVINYFEDDDEIMVIRFEGNEHSTFNGLYSRED